MKKNVLSKLNKFPYFSKTGLRSLSNDNENTINQNITRWINSGNIISLKKGFYTTKSFFDKFFDNTSYKEFVASILRRPSYISAEYILQKYDILTDMTYGVTSITTKTSRNYSNKLGNYNYRHIKNDLYLGFEEKHFLDNTYYVAKKAKALFDYLYYKMKNVNKKFKPVDLFKEMRIKINEFSKDEFDEFLGYCKLSGNSKFYIIYKDLNKNGNTN
ncbi:hypothetical protein ACFLY9_00075 [Patescibacteria group bacterium]